MAGEGAHCIGGGLSPLAPRWLRACRFPHFTFLSCVRDLGVSFTLDSSLTFSDHISNLTRSSYFHLRRLRAIRKSVSIPVFTYIVHAFVCSRIDYCRQCSNCPKGGGGVEIFL